MGHSEENIQGTAMGCVAAFSGLGSGTLPASGERWRVEELMVGKSSPILVDGRLYCCDDLGKLSILDAANGRSGDAENRPRHEDVRESRYSPTARSTPSPKAEDGRFSSPTHSGASKR